MTEGGMGIMKTNQFSNAMHANAVVGGTRMVRLVLVLALICMLLTGVLTACGSKDSGKTYDLQQVYQDILAAQPEGSDDLSGVMFETTDKDAIEEIYPGLGAIELKQEVCYQHAVTGFCEIMLVEAADSKDVQRIVDIFNQRIDTAADDSFYPETAQLWAQNAQVQNEGNYVALVALPDGYTVPEKIFS